MTTPYFSVIIPTFERDRLLDRALESVLRQNFDDIEVLVVDNAGSDPLRDSLQRRRLETVQYLRHTDTRGAASARNHGITHARGEIVCFLDDDDEFLPGMLDAMHRLFSSEENAQIAFSWSAIEKFVIRDGECIESSTYRIGARMLADRSFVLRTGTGCGLCVRADALRHVGGFDESMRVSEDRDLMLKLLETGYQCRPLPQVLHRRYYHEGDHLSQPQAPRIDLQHDLLLWENHREFMQRHPALLQKFLDQLGKNQFQCGDVEAALQTARDAWRASPLRIKSLRRLLRYLIHARLLPARRRN